MQHPLEDIVYRLMQGSKQHAAAYINRECMTNGRSETLDFMLDILLQPLVKIEDSENIDWIKWLVAGGRNFKDFSAIVRGYDSHAKCGLVWVPQVLAYRCRTCGISPCMSICPDCFKKGNHENHDYNMFLSQAGGACDCGDTSVMRAEGFCTDHGINNERSNADVPDDLMTVAKAAMPRLLLTLLLYFRHESYIQSDSEEPIDFTTHYDLAARACGEYINMLMELNNMGELMRNVMTKAFINPQLYEELVEPPFPESTYGASLELSRRKYFHALDSFPSPRPPKEYENLPALREHIKHTTLLEEFIFWTFKFEFPQDIVCFLLNMLPDQEYKEHLTRTFVMHYSRIPTVLEMTRETDKLSNRVVHMSVQLFSNESLALKMVEELSLLHVMIISLKIMMSKILIPSTLHDPEKSSHHVIDCAQEVMKHHCYWPLVSDFNNVLSHESVALVFLKDDKLIEMWFQLLSMLQGMNINVRETGNHIEFEPGSYYAAFSCELETSAYPLWSIISHLKDDSHADLARKMISVCISYLKDWLNKIDFTVPKIEKHEMMNASFHFPLHRYLAAFVCQAVRTMSMPLKDILPTPDILTLLMMHPLRVQSFFYEILSDIWIRNGTQIKGQALTYIQANFCNSMVDMDMFFLQICATQLPAHIFLSTAIEVFGVADWLGLVLLSKSQEREQDSMLQRDSMLEGLLTFLATIVCSRTNIGNDEPTQCILEISALLSTGDKTHSQLLELMPERSGSAHTRNFEIFREKLSAFRQPSYGTESLEQGLFSPVTEIWEKYYDPLHVSLRHRRDFLKSMERFTSYVKQQKKMPKSGTLWPPYRIPGPVLEAYTNPCCILQSSKLHATLFSIFYRAVHSHNFSEQLLSLAIFLLELAVTFNGNTNNSSVLECGNMSSNSDRNPPELLNCFPGDCLYENLRHVIKSISLSTEEPNSSPANYNTGSYDIDLDWDLQSETETNLPMLAAGTETSEYLPVATNSMEVDIAGPVSEYEGLVRRTPINRDESSGTSDSAAVVEYMPMTPHLALPPSTMQDAGGLEVAIRREFGLVRPQTNTRNQIVRQSNSIYRSSSNNNNNSGIMLPFQRVQPVAVSNVALDVFTGPSGPSRILYLGNKKRPIESNSNSDTIPIDESIISLLLKLHSQLSGTPDSFKLDDIDYNSGMTGQFDENMDGACSSSSSNTEENLNDNRIGDGPHFIGLLLRKIARADVRCAEHIGHVRQQLWPDQKQLDAEIAAKEKEERSRRAKERQKKLLQDMANDQKRFMAHAGEDMDFADEESEAAREKEYDCIICNITTPSTEWKPIGLVVLVESTGVVGHRRKTADRLKLPLSESDEEKLRREVRLTEEFNRRAYLLALKFGEQSWYMDNNFAYDSGVYVQSCGHHVHLECHESYMKSLPLNHGEREEFLCPLCRQLSNSILPLSSQLDRVNPVIRVPSPPNENLVQELSTLIQENTQRPKRTALLEAIGRAMEDMTNITTHRKAKRVSPSFSSLFIFVTSIARTNLEAEIVQRGGSLCSNQQMRYKPKRDCIVPLLHVLSVHVRVLNVPHGPMWRSWATIAGLELGENMLAAQMQSHQLIPNLLADPIALLLKFFLLAPLHLDNAYFTCIVRVMYNLLYYQIVLQLCTTMTELECTEILDNFSKTDFVPVAGVANLGSAMAFIMQRTNRCEHIRRESVDQSTTSKPIDWTQLENELKTLCLPYLRIAALLQHHLYNIELPVIEDSDLEFPRLVRFLNLVPDGLGDIFDASKALCFMQGKEILLPEYWCYQFMGVPVPTDSIRELIMNQHLTWHQPGLLELPNEYERLFTYYHERKCPNCNTVPKDCSICLLCGTIVCLKQNCCSEDDCYETIRHTIQCGGGTGIFLVVTSTLIIVIRGKRVCMWGSLYLDDFYEEDRDLKRGKPLYLCENRFNLLEAQWLSHRFAHTKNSWVPHRDSL